MSSLRLSTVAFENALISRRVASRFVTRYGMEHSSPEALQEYLKKHPKADKSRHTVKKDKGKGEEPKKDSEEPKKDEGSTKEQLRKTFAPFQKHHDDVAEERPVNKKKVQDSLKTVEHFIEHGKGTYGMDDDHVEDLKKTKEKLDKALKEAD